MTGVGRSVVLALAVGVVASACTENTAPGNDREAELEPPAPPAEVSSAGATLQNVATGLVKPQIMSDADRAAAPDVAGRCLFRMTRVGFPVLVYGPSNGLVKLNDRLVALPSTGEGRYEDGGVRVTVRPLEDGEPETTGLFPAEMVLRLPGASNELGFHGFAEC